MEQAENAMPSTPPLRQSHPLSHPAVEFVILEQLGQKVLGTIRPDQFSRVSGVRGADQQNR